MAGMHNDLKESSDMCIRSLCHTEKGTQTYTCTQSSVADPRVPKYHSKHSTSECNRWGCRLGLGGTCAFLFYCWLPVC